MRRWRILLHLLLHTLSSGEHVQANHACTSLLHSYTTCTCDPAWLHESAMRMLEARSSQGVQLHAKKHSLKARQGRRHARNGKAAAPQTLAAPDPLAPACLPSPVLDKAGHAKQISVCIQSIEDTLAQLMMMEMRTHLLVVVPAQVPKRSRP